MARGCRLSIALHPLLRGPKALAETDDSGQALDLPPNHRVPAIAAVSADNQVVASASSVEKPLSPRRPKQIGTARPATHGLRTSTKKDPV